MRTVRWGQGGRRWLEAFVTINAPGVVVTDSGRWFNPPEECEASAALWNAKPILVNHVGAGDVVGSAEVWERSGIGLIVKTHYDRAAVRGTALLDIGRLRAIDARLPPDSRILPRLLRGDSIDVSASFLYRVEKASGTFNGERYDRVSRDHEPKYLAVLPNDKGACPGAAMRLFEEG